MPNPFVKKLRWVGIIDRYFEASVIFTLYVPKEIDYDYRINVYDKCDKYNYINEKFINKGITYLLFYPKEFDEPDDENNKKLIKVRQDLFISQDE